jgi:PII-like signaling protein
MRLRAWPREATMTIPADGYLLRIFIGESDKHEGKPLYEWLVFRAREAGLAGATVLRGIEGFGAHSRLHTAKILRLSEDLPIVVEIVDSLEKIESFMPIVDDVIGEGLATLERVKVRFYRAGDRGVSR